jgi:hypothetical protein
MAPRSRGYQGVYGKPVPIPRTRRATKANGPGTQCCVSSMRRIWALVVAAIVVASAITIFWADNVFKSPAPCGSTSGGPTPLTEPLGAPPFSALFQNSSKEGNTYWYTFLLLFGGTRFDASQLSLKVSLSSGLGVAHVYEYRLWNGSDPLIAMANGTTGDWTEGSSSLVESLDNVSVLSFVSLVNDSFAATAPVPCIGDFSFSSQIE